MGAYIKMIEPKLIAFAAALIAGEALKRETGRSGMNIRAVIIGCLLMVAPVLARESTDVIVMKNGDHLTGEIKGMSQGVLYISMNYILGTSDVQWSKVDHIESKQLFLVKTEEGLVYTGTLSTAEASAGRPMSIEVVEAAEKPVVLERVKVVEMDQTSERFWQRFNGNVNTGIQYSKGNQSTQFNLSSEVGYPRERWLAIASYNSTLSASTGASAATRNQFNLGAQRLLRWSNWFYAGEAGLLQSSEQGISHQGNIGGGIGRYVMNSNRTKLYLLGGLAYQQTTYAPSVFVTGAQNVATGLFSGGLKFYRFNKTTIEFTGSLFPAISQPGRIYSNVNASYYIKLSGSLSWNVSFYGNWDNQPPPTFSGSDYGTSSGLSITFGNK
jgi:hypothetical protein